MRNPLSLVATTASAALRLPQPLQGELKLGAALRAFRPAVAGLSALDVGASTGGFTRALLEAGAARVYGEAEGIDQVIVNGAVVVEHGAFTDARPGTLLRSGRDSETPVLT